MGNYDQLKICDEFMPASDSQIVSDVHGLKLASHCGYDPGFKFWQVLARRIRDACKHESRFTPLFMVGPRASWAREQWEEYEADRRKSWRCKLGCEGSEVCHCVSLGRPWRHDENGGQGDTQ
jgi:hypothetical protein